MGGTGDKVGGGRCYQDEVSPARQFNMAHGRLRLDIQQIEVDTIAGQGLQGQRRNEFRCCPRHDHTHLGAGLAQESGQLCTLIGGDAAGNAQQNALVSEA